MSFDFRFRHLRHSDSWELAEFLHRESELMRRRDIDPLIEPWSPARPMPWSDGDHD